MPGVFVAPLTTQLAEELGAPNTRGALVNQMSPRLGRLRRRPPSGRHHHHLQLADRRRRVGVHADARRTRRPGTAARLVILRESRRLELTVPITRTPPRRAVDATAATRADG